MPYVIAGLIAAVAAVWAIGSYNGFIRLRNRIDESYATMDVYLKKRYDLIPNLVETVRGYAAHEQATFEKVIAARNAALSASGPRDKLEGEAALCGALKNLFALAENYPQLKADGQFLGLQQQLGAVEEDIAQSRKYYNAVVRGFNTRCQAFPSMIIARLGGFRERAYFEAADQREREAVKVKFDA